MDRETFRKAYRSLFLFAVFMMVTGDFARFPFGIRGRYFLLLLFSQPQFYILIFGACFLALLCDRGFQKERLLPYRFLLLPATLLVGAHVLSALFSSRRELSFYGLGIFAAALLFLIFFALFLEEDGILDRLPSVFSAAILFLSVRVILWRLSEGLGISAYQVMNNSWLGKAQISWVLNIFAPYFFMEFLDCGDLGGKVLYGAVWGAIGLALFLLFSRMGTLAFLLTTAALALAQARRWKRFLAIAVVGLAVLLPFTYRAGIMTRYVAHTLTHFYAEPGFMKRGWIWKDTWKMFCDHPVTGIGFGTYDDIAYSEYHNPYDNWPGQPNKFFRGGWHAHSIYLHPLAEVGILGIGAWIYLGWTFFMYLRIKWKESSSFRPVILSLGGTLFALFILGSAETIFAVRVHESFRMTLTLGLIIIFNLRLLRSREYAS